MPSSRTSRRDRELRGENTSVDRRSDSEQTEFEAHDSTIPKIRFRGCSKRQDAASQTEYWRSSRQHVLGSRSMNTNQGPWGVIGIHPAGAIGVVAVDFMLFGGTVAIAGAGWIVSVPIGLALGIAITLIQHRGSPQDDLFLAAGKGILIAILTAIPTPLPSAFVAAFGTAGAVSMLRQRRQRKIEGMQGSE